MEVASQTAKAAKIAKIAKIAMAAKIASRRLITTITKRQPTGQTGR